MPLKNLGKTEKLIFSSAILSFLVSLLLLRLSNFSASSVVNFQNYIIKNMILQSGNTLSALYLAFRPFLLVLVSMVFFSLAVSILSYYGCREDGKTVGKYTGLVAALFSVIIFPSIWGAFLAAAVFTVSYYAPQFSDMYSKEIKKWPAFRIGSKTAGKMLMVANIILVLGLFFAVLSSQAAYEAAFKKDLTESMKSLALSLPGASQIPSSTLEQRIESAIASSPLFTSYIIWLPVTTAVSAWFILEILRNLLLANISGLFTYFMLRKRAA